jgi:hypothetical protein
MRKINHKKIFIAILLAVCILALSSLSFAVSVSGIINTAKASGLDAIKSMLGLQTDVGSSLDTGYITVPAGEPFFIEVSLRTNGSYKYGTVCRSNLPVSYYNAQDPASVQYDFLNNSSVSLDQTSKIPNPTTVTLYSAASCSCGKGCRTCCPRSYQSPATTYIDFIYKKIITVPSNQPDGNINVKITVAPILNNTISNLDSTVPGKVVSGNTVTIPVKVYTPLRKMFHIKKWK